MQEINNLPQIIFKYTQVAIPAYLTDLVDHTSHITYHSIFVLFPPKSSSIDKYKENIINSWKHHKANFVIFVDGSEKYFIDSDIIKSESIFTTEETLYQIVNEYYCKRPKYIVGVTGSGGKTSTTNLIYQLATDLNIPAAALSTFGLVGLNNQEVMNNNINTTYSYITTRRVIHHSAIENKELLAIEVSSHGIGENRIKNIEFNGGIWTSFSIDHMEYHKTLENYFNTKRKFFESLPISIVGQQVLDFIKTHPELKLTKTPTDIVGMKENNIKDDSYTYNGVNYKGEFKMQFYQRVNLLSAMVLLYRLGYKKAIEYNGTYLHIPARMEFFGYTLQGAPVYSDDAYRPDNMETVLQYFDEYNLKRVILIVGAGGDKDRGEHYRSNIGKMADKVHKLIVTDDNPRTESPSKIRNEIAEGKQNIWIIPYRSDALQVAFSFSDKNKIILILSHGSEELIRYKDYYSCMTDKEVFEYYLMRFKV